MGDGTIVWFRQDLRLADNPALLTAVVRGGPVIPVFIWAPQTHRWAAGARTRWWLARSLAALDAELRARGSRLVLRQGFSAAVLAELAAGSGATAVHWNRRYEPWSQARDARVAAALTAAGVAVQQSNALLLHEPWEVSTQQGGPFQVFSAYWRRAHTLGPVPRPLPAPAAIPPPVRWPESDASLVSIGPGPAQPELTSAWTPGAAGALAALDAFLPVVEGYDGNRNRPDLAATSRLSPHLHFGELGPRQVWAALDGRSGQGVEVFRNELGWREFAYHLLHHFPGTPDAPLRADFARLLSHDDPPGLAAWQSGRTGYPIVDAGMRQLAATGWMHNRVRMIVASFLTKDLLLPWHAGARWFWEQLVDADMASNTQGWQWTAGCGADAAPYFRVFNPVRQGLKFDPQGTYVRRWVPELAGLAAPAVHQPWRAAALELAAAGVRLGETYPVPMVEHAQARAAALAAYRAIKS